MRRGRRAAGRVGEGGGVARERRSRRRERRGVGWIARKAVRVACHACPVGLFCRRQRGFSVGTGEGNPRPHRWCTHARSGLASVVRVAREPGHASGSGSTSLRMAGDGRRRRPGWSAVGLWADAPGTGVPGRSSTYISVDGSAPIGDAATVTLVTGLEKPLNEIETWMGVSALAVVVGALPCHTLVTQRGASERERGPPRAPGDEPVRHPIPGTAGTTTFPDASVPPRTPRRRVEAPCRDPEVPARSEEKSPT